MLTEACASRRRSHNSGKLLVYSDFDKRARSLNSVLFFWSAEFILRQRVESFDQFWLNLALKSVPACLVSLQFVDSMHASLSSVHEKWTNSGFGKREQTHFVEMCTSRFNTLGLWLITENIQFSSSDTKEKSCLSQWHFGIAGPFRWSVVSLLVSGAALSGSAAVLRGRDCIAMFHRTHARRRPLSKFEPDRELRGRLAELKGSLCSGIEGLT